jgi:hypothetical protein
MNRNVSRHGRNGGIWYRDRDMRTVAASLLLLLTGCLHFETEYMRDAGAPGLSHENDARVIVFRPSAFGGNTQFPIFEYAENEVKLMGFAESGCVFEYRCAPGKHLFLTWGEGEAYIEADLAAKRTYYIRCFARLGILAPRPRFTAVRPGTDEWKNLDNELKDLQPRELNPAKADAFEDSKEERVRKAKASMDEGKKNLTELKPEDGR